MGIKDSVFYRKHRDDEGFDEVVVMGIDGPVLRVITVPRYKTSELSGDEWRTSSSAQIKEEYGWRDIDRKLSVEIMCQALFADIYTDHPDLHHLKVLHLDFLRKDQKLYESSYDGKPLPILMALGHLPWVWIIAREESMHLTNDRSYCFQPGCPEKATSILRLKKEYSRMGMERLPTFELRRSFCRRHLRRGDCGLEDADVNYEIVDGPGPDEALIVPDDRSESVFGGVIEVDLND